MSAFGIHLNLLVISYLIIYVNDSSGINKVKSNRFEGFELDEFTYSKETVNMNHKLSDQHDIEWYKPAA